MSTWNAKAKKIVGCVAAVTVLCGSSALAYAAGAGVNASDKTKSEPAVETTVAEESPAPQSKDETVYVLAGADGAVKKIIVSDWVKNTAGAAQITDESDVNDPQNVKSDAGYTLSQDGLRVWDAQGEDIYYQGTVDKELPVTLSVKYTLDGAAVSPEELAGKSGKVTMRFDYENRQSETVTIDGKPTKIYVPFVMMTGMILDNDVFRNVTVSNGKLINDGDRSVVMGFAMPGMQENLALDSDQVDIPSYVEITADVTDFELATTLTLATNELFNEVDVDKFDSLDELTAKMDDLTDAMNRLIDGSSKLYTNLKTLTEKSRTLVSSIDQLADGAGQLAAGAQTVTDGAKTVADGSAQIYTNMATLSAGLQTLTSNNADLTDGAKKVFDTLLDTANTQIKAAGLDVPALTVDSYAETLEQVAASLDEASVRALAEKTARETVTAKVDGQEAVIREKVTEAVREQVLSAVLAKAMNGMTVEQYQQAVAAGLVDAVVQAQVNGAVEQQMQSAEMQATVQKNVEEQKTQLIEQAMAGDEVKGQIEQAVAKAAAGVQQLTTLKEQLDSYNTFYQGVLVYTAGADTAAAGAQQLTDGARQLTDGSTRLSDGAEQLSSSAATLANYLNELRDQSAALPDGAQQLTNGAMQLSDGLKELNEQGVKKLADAVNGDLNGLVARVRATVDVSKDYDNFAGKATGTDGTVRFVYRTDSIEPASAD